jgi:tetratricopeptide (TPR) repeat protein
MRVAASAATALGDTGEERWARHELALLASKTGQLDEARQGYAQALTLARQLHDPAAEAAELRKLGVFIGQHGEPEQGRALIRESLAISERLSDIYNIGKCHQFLAWLDEGEGKRAEAIEHYREARRCFARVQAPDAAARARLRALGAEEAGG